jgi:hypothetical protein
MSVVVVGLAALAETSPLLASAGVSGGKLSIVSTKPMPKGWFNLWNRLDRTHRMELRVTYTIGATVCSSAMTGTLSSYAHGTEVRNTNLTNVAGRNWSADVSVSSYAEHYSLHENCDGVVETVGCNVPRPVSVTIQALNQNGQPLIYTDDSGAPQYMAVTLDAGSIAPVFEGLFKDACESPARRRRTGPFAGPT